MRQSATPKADILVADDTPANLRLLFQMLTEQGYKVRPVPDGQWALRAARSTPPDLILLDIRMPKMDGYQVCEQIKADERTRDIPVLFLSALGEKEDKVKAFAVGGVDYITKPFQVEEVLARVRTHLSLRALQKQLEAANERLVRSNAELRERNEELDAFVHTVAHDLKSPLAIAAGYAEMLALSCDELEIDEIRSTSRLTAQMAHSPAELDASDLPLEQATTTGAPPFLPPRRGGLRRGCTSAFGFATTDLVWTRGSRPRCSPSLHALPSCALQATGRVCPSCDGSRRDLADG
jgi:DNA-binding response OmpR family regulator